MLCHCTQNTKCSHDDIIKHIKIENEIIHSWKHTDFLKKNVFNIMKMLQSIQKKIGDFLY